MNIAAFDELTREELIGALMYFKALAGVLIEKQGGIATINLRDLQNWDGVIIKHPTGANDTAVFEAASALEASDDNVH